MEASKLSRLREEQLKAVSETEEKLTQFEKFKGDYKALQKRLETLPDKVTHDVMVPFGKLAFMPGQLVHTNEILVLLGDNWFAERSAKQASEITDRRIKELDNRISELKKQKSLLEPRLGMTSELQDVAEGIGDYKEIIEEYDEEKERLWDEQHRINMRRHHKKIKEQRNASIPKDKKRRETKSETAALNKNDEDLWSRLEDLEKQEEERGELNSSFESDDGATKEERGQDTEDGNSQSQRKGKVSSPTRDKRVNWPDEEREEDDEDSDDDHADDDDDYDNDEDSEEDESETVVRTITFRHSNTPSSTLHLENLESASSHDGATTPNITSPGEIYKLFSPKPILKKTTDPSSSSSTPSHAVRFPDRTGDHGHIPDGDRPNEAVAANSSFAAFMDSSREKAFTGVVKEKPTTRMPTSTTANTQEQQPKRVSKFKAQRMGKN